MKTKKIKLFFATNFLFLFFVLTNNYAQGLYISTLNNLDFGDVFTGLSADVAHTDIGAAKFMAYQTGALYPLINFRFTLPASLTNGGHSIPITFDFNHSAWSNSDSPTDRTNFTPQSGFSTYLFWLFQRVYIWLGARITTDPNISGGVYQGTIILTVEYN